MMFNRIWKFFKSKRESNETTRLALWLVNRNSGLSSRAIASATITGQAPINFSYSSYPYYVSDLRKCWDLLDQVPEARRGITCLARFSLEWARLDAHWEELKRIYVEENSTPTIINRDMTGMTGVALRDVLHGKSIVR